MTGYPNEDEGPDEVNWQNPQMSEEKMEHMSLIARLQKPMWVHSSNPFEGRQLEREETLAAMSEAAAAIADLVKALDQVKVVCDDNAPDSCDKKMALDFVRQVAAAALAKVKP